MGLSNAPVSFYVKSFTEELQNISIGSFHASFHNFHNVSIHVKWPQKLVMVTSTKMSYFFPESARRH